MHHKKEDDGLKLDKKIPVAVIVVLVLHTFGVGWFASDLHARVENLEISTNRNNEMIERIVRIEAQVSNIKEQNIRIENMVQRIINLR